MSKSARFCVDFWNVFGRFLEGCWKGSYANFQLFLGLFDAIRRGLHVLVSKNCTFLYRKLHVFVSILGGGPYADF